MSWGQKDCVLFGSCKVATVATCNTKCEGYVLDPEYKAVASVAPPSEGGPQIRRSEGTKFSKAEDMIVLGGKIFEIQSITPKKMLLRYRQKMSQTAKATELPDGVFNFVIGGKVQNVAKVLRENKIRLSQDGGVNANESSQK